MLSEAFLQVLPQRANVYDKEVTNNFQPKGDQEVT